MYNYLLLLISILLGAVSALLLYSGKKLALLYKRPKLDLLFSLTRFTILIAFLYTILQFNSSNSILLLILFLLSYVGTVSILVYVT